MGIKKTVIGVIAFILVLIAAGYSAQSNAEQSAYIGVGKTVINSHLKVGTVGYTWNGWEASARLLEDGDTKNGRQDQVALYSVSYLTEPGWGYRGVEPYFRLGLGHNSGSNLVGPTNYSLGVGLNFHRVFRLEFVHDSSAGIHPTNTGIDQAVLTYTFQPPWEGS